MTIKELMKQGMQNLNANKIDDSSVKARSLLQYVLKKSKQQLIFNSEVEVEKENEISYMKYLQELIQGKPLQYITNYQEFMGLEIYVNENVLIPQPDTEILVEEAIKEIKERIVYQNIQSIRILDLCTGSGAIAISIAKYFENHNLLSCVKDGWKNMTDSKIRFEIYGTDISQKALEIAKKNAIDNEVKVKFVLSDMFDSLDQNLFDIIISNPPYIETDTIKTLAKDVQKEPYIALNGGKDGLNFYRIIAKNAHQFLKEKRLSFIGDWQ